MEDINKNKFICFSNSIFYKVFDTLIVIIYMIIICKGILENFFFGEYLNLLK